MLGTGIKLPGTRSGYFARTLSDSAFRSSKECSCLNFILTVAKLIVDYVSDMDAVRFFSPSSQFPTRTEKKSILGKPDVGNSRTFASFMKSSFCRPYFNIRYLRFVR